jgi:DNA-binding XRE family transcriptional regulator
VNRQGLDVLEWLDSVLHDTEQMQLIEAREKENCMVAVALRKARESLGWSQGRMAKVLKVNSREVLAWERMDSSPSLALLVDFCHASGLNLEINLSSGRGIRLDFAAQMGAM